MANEGGKGGDLERQRGAWEGKDGGVEGEEVESKCDGILACHRGEQGDVVVLPSPTSAASKMRNRSIIRYIGLQLQKREGRKEGRKEGTRPIIENRKEGRGRRKR